MSYEWDEQKRLKNLERHRLDFRDAWRVYEHPDRVTVKDPYPHEDRFRTLADINGDIRLLVYTMRGEVVRCISFRAAKRKERRFYNEQIEDR